MVVVVGVICETIVVGVVGVRVIVGAVRVVVSHGHVNIYKTTHSYLPIAINAPRPQQAVMSEIIMMILYCS